MAGRRHQLSDAPAAIRAYADGDQRAVRDVARRVAAAGWVSEAPERPSELAGERSEPER